MARSRGPDSAGPTSGEPAAAPPDEEGVEFVNDVRLVGRLSRPALERELPSGDLLAVFCVVVDRPPPRGARPPVAKRTVDSLDCVAWTAGTRKRVLAFTAGEVVEVHGALRRRFFLAGAARASRYEVEVAQVKRVRRAPRVRRTG